MQRKHSEKRRYPRLDFCLPMRYRKLKTDTHDFTGSLMNNISAGGAKMSIYEFLPLDLKLAIEIPLESGVKPVEGTGRVAWVRKTAFNEQYDVGVEFTILNQEDEVRIADFVTTRAEKASIAKRK